MSATGGEFVGLGDPRRDAIMLVAQAIGVAGAYLNNEPEQGGFLLAGIAMAVATLWSHVNDEDFQVILDSISEAAHANRAVKQAQILKAEGKLT